MSNAMKASLALGATAAALGGVAYVSGQRKKSKEAAAAASKEHARQQQVVSAMILEFENFGQGLSESLKSKNVEVFQKMESFKTAFNSTLGQIATAINEDPPNYPAVTQLQTELQGTINAADTFLKETLTSVPPSSPLYAKISSIAQKVANVAGTDFDFVHGLIFTLAFLKTLNIYRNGVLLNSEQSEVQRRRSNIQEIKSQNSDRRTRGLEIRAAANARNDLNMQNKPG
jgi:Tfp pilus assembly protein PilN